MERGKKLPILEILQKNTIVIMIVALSIVVSTQRPNFFSRANMINLAGNTAVRFLVALGVSGCLISKGTDLSAGRVTGLAACLGATLLQRADTSGKFFPFILQPNLLTISCVLLLIAAVTGFIGVLNGSIISFLKVPPFIATLGVQTIVYGFCLIFTGAKPIGSLMPEYTQVARATIGNVRQGVPYMVLGVAAVGFVMWFLYNKTRHGKYMYAIGGNENAAEVSGVNVSRTKILIYMAAGILYGLAGFILAARSGGASVNTAQGYELEAIAACTIGGVSTNGGVGRVSGILIGVLVFEVLKISLQFMGVPGDYTYIAQGLVIITAVALDLRNYLTKK